MSQGQNTPAASDQAVSQVPLKSLGLRPGLALQVRRLVEGATKKEAQLFGAIENKGVMVGAQGSEGDDPALNEGEICIVRGFTGQHEFSFVSKVLQTFDQPFSYALLAYPNLVDARQVRQSMRTRTSWPITVSVAQQRQDGRLVDISMQGAMVRTAGAVAQAGSIVRLEIQAEVEGEPTALSASALVCHSHKSTEGEGLFTGMAFQGLSQQDKLVLHYLTHTPQS